MDGDGRSILFFAVVIFIFVLFFLYALAESALTELPNARVKSFEHEKGMKKRLFKLLKKSSRLHMFFTQIRIVSTLWVCLWSYVITDAIFPNAVKFVFGSIWLDVIVYALIFVVIALIFESVFVYALPKRIIWNMKPDTIERTALFLVPLVEFTLIILTPLILLSTAIVSVLSWLFGLKSQADTEVTEEEILMMVDAGTDTGTIEESQAEMITGVFEFSDTPVSDIMTHRTDIAAVRDTAAACDIAAKAADSGHSRLPVYKDTIDRIIGIINVKDLLPLIINNNADSDKKAAEYLRPVIYVPESATAKNIFKKLTDSKMQMAVITDEYGGTAGIVTIEDLLETIVGDIMDEYDDEIDEIKQIDDRTFIIDGLADPKDVLAELKLPLPRDEDEFDFEFDTFDTMSAFLMELAGVLPDNADNITVNYEHCIFTALSVSDMRITLIKAEIITANASDSDEKND
jgi:putative hemolysin